MKPMVIIFARAPRLGQVKTRLGRAIGARAALNFHRSTLLSLCRAIKRDGRFDLSLALTPDDAFIAGLGGVSRFGQKHGDLGARMQRAFDHFPHRPVILVGCDIPDLGVAHIKAAAAALGRTRAVFGPAHDGGYYLVGFAPLRPAGAFKSVRWSTNHALADTQVHIRGKTALLEPLDDIDDQAAFNAWKSRLNPPPRAGACRSG
jgi:rSAM/selenodomain-associated transferase 1